MPISLVKNKQLRLPLKFLRQCVASLDADTRFRRRRRRRRRRIRRRRTAAAETRCHQLRHSVTIAHDKKECIVKA
jgi:hypothetical protein